MRLSNILVYYNKGLVLAADSTIITCHPFHCNVYISSFRGQQISDNGQSSDFSGQLWYLIDQTKYDQMKLLDTLSKGKSMNLQQENRYPDNFKTLIISTAAHFQ